MWRAMHIVEREDGVPPDVTLEATSFHQSFRKVCSGLAFGRPNCLAIRHEMSVVIEHFTCSEIPFRDRSYLNPGPCEWRAGRVAK